jgi:hypothetical protein
VHKRTITYETWNDPPEKVTETLYFNLTVPEFGSLQTDIDENDVAVVVSKMDEIILRAYGVKSEDGRNFEKSEDLKRQFASSAAYASLTEELMTNEKALADFIKAVLPKQFQDELTKILATQASGAPAISPPPPPTL